MSTLSSQISEWATPLHALLLLGALASAILISFTYQIIYHHYFSPLAPFPGPFWWTVSRLPYAYSSFRGHEIADSRRFIKKYGPVVRITPTLLLVSTASTLPLIYHRTARKTPHYTLFSFGAEGTIFHMRSHAEYTARAKAVAGIYTARAKMPETERLMDRNIVAWIAQLRRRFIATPSPFPSPSLSLSTKHPSTATPPLDFAQWVRFLNMDTTLEQVFSACNALDYVANGADMLGICEGFKTSLPLYGVFCRTWPFFEWVNTTWFGPVWEFVMLHLDWQVGKMTRFVEARLRERLRDMEAGDQSGEEGGKKGDMMQALIDTRTPDGQPLSRTTLRGEVEIVVMAGADNNTAGSCTVLHHLLTHPAALTRVLTELSSARAAGLISSSSSSVPQQSSILAHLPYYVACVKESLRLNPSLPSALPRCSPGEGEKPLVLHGMTIPPNTEVASNPWITQRDPEVYGADAEEWKPERWLEAENAKVLEKYSFTFGYGTRPCLGKAMGLMSVYKIPLMFLSTFEARIAPKSKPWIGVRADFSFWEDFMVEIAERKE